MTRFHWVSLCLVGAVGAAVVLRHCGVDESVEGVSEETARNRIHPEPTGDYRLSSLMVPAGEWWCSTERFSMLLQMGIKDGLAAVSTRGGGDSLYVAVVRVLTDSDLSLDDRFELELTNDAGAITMTGHMPDIEGPTIPDTDEDLIDRLVIDYVRGAVSARRGFDLLLFMRHEPPEDLRMAFDRLRTLIASVAER